MPTIPSFFVTFEALNHPSVYQMKLYISMYANISILFPKSFIAIFGLTTELDRFW